MAENVRELTDGDFDEAIRGGVTLVDFWAPWCGPCQQQGPILEEVAGTVGEKASVSKVNVDEHSAAAGRFGVQSIPTLILFKDGEEMNRFVGVQQASVLKDAIEQAL